VNENGKGWGQQGTNGRVLQRTLWIRPQRLHKSPGTRLLLRPRPSLHRPSFAVSCAVGLPPSLALSPYAAH
jgi:hypothetical protein